MCFINQLIIFDAVTLRGQIRFFALREHNTSLYSSVSISAHELEIKHMLMFHERYNQYLWYILYSILE